MKKLTVLLLFWLASLGAAVAQPVTTTVPGTLLTYPFTATGKITTLTPTTGTAGFNLPQGTAPSSPTNGDIWMTSAGLFFRNAGVTAGPIGSSGLIINGTPVTGGAATNVLYTDGSKLQAYVAVPLSILGSTSAAPTIAGNTMLGNWANATGAIVAQSMPPCSDTGGQHLNYVGNIGITCGTSGSGYAGENHQAVGGSNYNLAPTDASKTIDMDCSSACTLTVVSGLTNNMKLDVVASNVGPVLIQAGSGVTLTSRVGTTIYLSTAGSGATLYNNFNAGGINVWEVVGDIIP